MDTSILMDTNNKQTNMTDNNGSKQNFYFIDTHAHLDMLKKMTPDFAVKESLRENVKFIINVGSSLEGSKKSLEYSKLYNNVFASVGVHPHDAEDFKGKDLATLETLLKNDSSSNRNDININEGHSNNNRNKKVVAVGETGFDYFRNLSPKKDQEKAFITQIELALKYDLPLIVHDRDAHADTLRILGSYSSYKDKDKDKKLKAVVHCFLGDPGFALKCLELGLFISFTGIITFPSAKNLGETVKEVPIDKIFIETDTPYLAPQEKRGQENYPGFVKYIAYKIAEIKNMSVDEVALITSKNAENFFSLI